MIELNRFFFKFFVRIKIYVLVCCETCLKFKYLNATKYQLRNKNYKLIRCQDLNHNPCFNNGKCVNINNNSHIGFDCDCKKGFNGPLCLNHHPCSLNPCQENEICFEYGELGHFSCLCPSDHPEYPYCRTELVKSNLTVINRHKLNSNLIRKCLSYVNLFLYFLFIIINLKFVFYPTDKK